MIQTFKCILIAVRYCTLTCITSFALYFSGKLAFHLLTFYLLPTGQVLATIKGLDRGQNFTY